MDVLNVNPFCLVRYGACARVRYFLLSTYVECGRQPGVNKCDLATRCRRVQRSAKINAPGLVTFVPALALHFCLSLPAAFTQPVASTLADPCEWEGGGGREGGSPVDYYFWRVPSAIVVGKNCSPVSLSMKELQHSFSQC